MGSAIRDQMLYGSPVLLGDNTIPGVKYTPELEAAIPKIIEACAEFGLDPYPPIVELLTYDEISEVAAYGGFPVRYPHWRFGMEYEQLSRGYEHGMHKIYEMVINNNPSYIYCLDSNPLLDHVTVVAHALGHSDFFKNNAWFAPTTENALNEMANHGVRIRRYMDKHGTENVMQFIDWVLAIDDLIDFSASWDVRRVKDLQIKDVKNYHHPRRLKIPSTDGEQHDYMADWVNPTEFKQKEAERVKRTEAIESLNLFMCKDRDIVGYLIKNAPLTGWQQDIMTMLYRESQYFAPQGLTKMLNEGWACVRRNTLLNTDKGLLTIGEIVDNKMSICVYDGQKMPQIVNWFKFENRKCFKIKTHKGYYLEGADNHRLQLEDGSWKQLSEFKVGDEVPLHLGQNIWPEEYVKVDWEPKQQPLTWQLMADKAQVSMDTVRRFAKGENVIKSKDLLRELFDQYLVEEYIIPSLRKGITIPKIVDESLASVLGYMVGDGHISVVKRVLGLTSGDEEQADNYKYLSELLFGVDFEKDWDDSSLNGRWRVLTNCKNLEDFFVSLGLTTGFSARIKKIPDCILRSPKSVMTSFLRSYFDADAGAYEDDGIILSSSSPEMVRQIQIVLLNYGILSNSTLKAKDNYHVYITGLSAKHFYEQIGFGLSRKQEALRVYVEDRNYFKKENYFDEIVEITEFVDDVYDITVDSVEHKYYAQGHINHNSYVDYNIMARRHWADGSGIWDYSRHKMGVLGGKYSMNPYSVGFKLFLEIEDRWNKGRFGREYRQCTDIAKRNSWDIKAGLGHEKVFETRACYNDLTAIHEFVDQEFVDKYEMYVWEKHPRSDGGFDYRIKTRDVADIKRLLMQRYSNGGRPDIRLVDPNYANKNIFLMEHQNDGRTLLPSYAMGTLTFLWNIWNNGGESGKRPVAVATYNKDGKEIVYVATGKHSDQVGQMSRKQFEDNFA